MGRGPDWQHPRHLAIARRSRTDAREHQVAEWLLAAVAIVLTVVVLVAQMVGRPGPASPGSPAPGPPAGSGQAGRPPGPGPTAPPAAATPGPGAWLALGGARVERSEPAGAGRRAGGFTATGPGDQGIALPGLLRPARGRTYAATLLLRTSRPGTLVQVSLLEVAGGRRQAADTIGAVLEGQGWRRVEVTHEAHLPGTALAVEVVLPRGSPRATVLVGDLEVTAA